MYPSSQFYKSIPIKNPRRFFLIQASLRSSWVKARFPGAESGAWAILGWRYLHCEHFVNFVVEVEKYRVLDQVPSGKR